MVVGGIANTKEVAYSGGPVAGWRFFVFANGPMISSDGFTRATAASCSFCHWKVSSQGGSFSDGSISLAERRRYNEAMKKTKSLYHDHRFSAASSAARFAGISGSA
jgi:hypothetical protein